ncbi:MAG: hypothetical protein WAZ19_12370 [Anaerolineae bacterium]
MQYLGVDTWDDVLAMFGEGGAMAGAWGILGLLREAELGDNLDVWWSVLDNPQAPFLQAKFYEENGQLMIEGIMQVGAHKWQHSMSLSNVADLHDTTFTVYGTDSLGVYARNGVYGQIKFDASRVDWVGVGLDAAGIAADVISLGIGGRVINGIQIAGAANAAGQLIDGASLLKSSARLRVDLANGTASAAAVGDVGLDVAGIWVPIVPDSISLVLGLGQGFYTTP